MHLLWVAFLYGTASAVSFPMGALLGIFMSPVRKDVGASFVAFGAGALLFAVTVEIYGHILADFHKGDNEHGALLMWCTIAATFTGAAGYLYLNAAMEHAIEGDSEAGSDKGHDDADVKSVSSQSALTDADKSDEDENWEPVVSNEAARLSLEFGKQLSERSNKESPREPPKEEVPAPAPLPTKPKKAAQLQVPGPKKSTPEGSLCSSNRIRTKNLERLHVGAPSMRRKSLAKLKEISMETEHKLGKLEGRKARLSTLCTEAHAIISSPEMPEKNYGALEDGEAKIEVKIPERSEEQIAADNAKNIKLAMSLFLGLVVDGIPEAALLGFLVAEGYLSYVLILAIFLANFPEAFSSASLMTEANIAKSVILGMWTGLCALTGLLCMGACGVLMAFGGAKPGVKPFEMELSIAIVEGLAAGSMICCISAVMLPEAYERRNQDILLASSGFLCAAGFLSAVALKVIESEMHSGDHGHGEHFFFVYRGHGLFY